MERLCNTCIQSQCGATKQNQSLGCTQFTVKVCKPAEGAPRSKLRTPKWLLLLGGATNVYGRNNYVVHNIVLVYSRRLTSFFDATDTDCPIRASQIITTTQERETPIRTWNHGCRIWTFIVQTIIIIILFYDLALWVLAKRTGEVDLIM